MEIYEKRGIWYVTNPPHPLKKFDSEEDAIKYTKGHAVEEPDEDDWDDDWDDDDE